jgi:tetratricopeptide (TPR) repeat protein
LEKILNSRVITSLTQGLVIVFILHISAFFSGAAESCNQSVGTLVSLQGEVQIQREGRSDWQSAAMDVKFCPGDTLRVNADARAAVFLSNESILRIDQNSSIHFLKPSPDNISIIKIFRGIFHIFSHRPHSLKVITPYVNGDVEGTEFLVRVDSEATVITVFEGLVTAGNAGGRLNLSDGQSALARQGKAPMAITIVRPRDAVEWTLYYPDIVEYYKHSLDNEVAAQFRRINHDLSIGRVDVARDSLEKILLKDPNNSQALALSSIIETVGNNKDQALEFAVRATKINPDSASAGLALSYAYQAQFNITAALETLKHAAASNPENGLVKARLAELLLSVGELDQALAAASEAASLNPSSGLGWTVLGFAHLSRIETDEAMASFSKAIELDSAFPLARLGLGLAKIREGKLEDGRADIEIAAALDPGNAIIRSYLGKAYFEEKRDSNAQRQYEIAKQLDPSDPTPWLYDAIRKETSNCPVEALHDLQQSIALNDNRAVYRSRLLLDDDLAARSAGLGRIYTDLGFEQLAQAEGSKSLQADPSNYSTHRFLADIYSNIPHHEIARVSELLQSQLLQPLNITPVQPQLSESDMSILEGTGPSSASTNEFNPLFLRDRTTLQASGVAGNNGILGNEMVMSGIEGRLSYSLGQLHYQTKGIRDNNDLKQDIYTVFLQTMLSPTTSLMTEVRYKEKNYGDLTFQFDPTDFSSTLRQDEQAKTMRIGMRHDLAPNSILLGTAIISSDNGSIETGNDGFQGSTDISIQTDGQMAEVQHIYKGQWINIQSGAGYLSADETDIFKQTFPFLMVQNDDNTTKHVTIYSYSRIDLSHDFVSTIGFGMDSIDSQMKTSKELSPKLGITWQPQKTTLIRAAVFKSVTRFLIYGQTIEPTQISGFNQFFDDLEGTTSRTYGLGVDQTFSPDLHGGLQFFQRNLDVPYFDNTLFSTPEIKEDSWKEGNGSAYLYWALVKWMAIGLEYNYEHYTHNQYEGLSGIQELTTQRITPKLQFFSPCGLSARLQASYIYQSGDFGSHFFGYTTDSDEFWVVDFSVNYRLPNRFGIFKIGVKNLFDQHFHFLDTDPENSRFPTERQIIGTLTMSF